MRRRACWLDSVGVPVGPRFASAPWKGAPACQARVERRAGKAGQAAEPSSPHAGMEAAARFRVLRGLILAPADPGTGAGWPALVSREEARDRAFPRRKPAREGGDPLLEEPGSSGTHADRAGTPWARPAPAAHPGALRLPAHRGGGDGRRPARDPLRIYATSIAADRRRARSQSRETRGSSIQARARQCDPR